MAILHQWDAAGRDIRSNGLAEGHNGFLHFPDRTYFNYVLRSSHRKCAFGAIIIVFLQDLSTVCRIGVQVIMAASVKLKKNQLN